MPDQPQDFGNSDPFSSTEPALANAKQAQIAAMDVQLDQGKISQSQLPTQLPKELRRVRFVDMKKIEVRSSVKNIKELDVRMEPATSTSQPQERCLCFLSSAELMNVHKIKQQKIKTLEEHPTLWGLRLSSRRSLTYATTAFVLHERNTLCTTIEK